MRPTSRSLVVFAVACAAAACAEGTTVVPMPAELIGRWQATQAEYADRFFELSADAVVIGTGGTTRQRYMISEVSRLTDENGLLYKVAYRDADGEEYTMGFYFDSAGGGTLRLENQTDMVWRKVRR